MQYIHIKEYICQYMCLRLDLEYWTCKKWDTHTHIITLHVRDVYIYF